MAVTSDPTGGGQSAAPAEQRAWAPRSVPTAPTLSLPRGGGALRGLGEKFTAQASTGSARLSVPLGLSPGRGGSGPELSLEYDSAHSMSVWGLGWQVAVPAVTHKTDDGVPLYRPGPGPTGVPDTLILSGAEDLVPELERRDGDWVPHRETRTCDGLDYEVTRHRPRTEGLFARIERWTRRDTGETHWRSVSRENVTSRFGLTPASRVADPADPARVFSWLLCDTRDAHGNAVEYEYKPEDAAGVDLTAAHERHRGPRDRTAQRHLKRVRYGNRRPLPPGAPAADAGGWLFEVVFDYGEHDPERPTPREDRPWACRPDPTSTRRPGFEVRGYRLCRRVLMFHHVPEDPDVGADCLVRALELTHRADPTVSLLTAVQQVGYRGRVRRAMPPLELTYSPVELGGPVRTLEPDALPLTLTDQDTAQWADLDCEGAEGLLCGAPGAWHYLRNLGDGRFRREPVASMPTTASVAGTRLLDLARDGSLDLVELSGPNAGFHERTRREGWSAHRSFRSAPVLPPTGEHVLPVDLVGDGTMDLLVLGEEAATWLPSLGEAGYAAPRRALGAPGGAPRVLARSASELVAVADLTGDGLAGIVRVRNGEVCVWPSVGWGRFGPMVRMDDPPWFDRPDRFDPTRLLLVDADRTGPADLCYQHPDGIRLYRNRAGNGWGPAERVTADGVRADGRGVAAVDLFGTGRPVLVWAEPGTGRPARYVELQRGRPHLLVGARNNLGAETRVRYASSTRFALRERAADRAAGRDTPNRMPFPIDVVEHVEVLDAVSGRRQATRYAYHRGDYDEVEREPCGFGMVEQWDTDTADGATGRAADPPVLTRTWFHPGLPRVVGPVGPTAPPEGVRGTDGVRHPHRFTAAETRQAHRALRGTVLRREVYGLDGSVEQDLPYTVTEQTHELTCLQPAAGGNRHAVFRATPHRTRTAHHERGADPRVTDELVLDTDGYGDVLRSATIARARRDLQPDVDEQAADRVLVTSHDYTAPLDGPDVHRTPVRWQTRSHEYTGPGAGDLLGAAGPGELVEHTRVRFRRDDLSGPLPFGELGALALPDREFRLAVDRETAEVFGGRLEDAALREAGLVRLDGLDGWWLASGTVGYAPGTPGPAAELGFARRHFFLPHRFVDPFGAATEVRYDRVDLLVVQTRDALGNVVATRPDHRTLQPAELVDPNGNRTRTLFDALGLPTATAVLGRSGEGLGDALDGLDPDTETDPLAEPHAVLGRATTRVVHDLWAYVRDGTPARVVSLERETHTHELAPGDRTRIRRTVAYSDGFGREVQRATLAKPAPDGAPRWIVSGWTVFDGKGRVVRRFEPFHASGPGFVADGARGVGSVLCHDPVGRVVATLHPDGSWEKVVVGAWGQESWDGVDTVLDDPRSDPDVGRFVAARVDPGWTTWFERRRADALGPDAADAARRAAESARTPTRAWFDPLGRVVRTCAHLRADGVDEHLVTRRELDVEGRERAFVDACGRVVVRHRYDRAGRRVHRASMEAGELWSLPDASGRGVRTWSSRGVTTRTELDALRRPLRTWVTEGRVEGLRVSVEYGEGLPADQARNLRGRVFRVRDGAGETVHEQFDFRGNLTHVVRRLTREVTRPDWAGPVALEDEEHRTETRFDALGRPVATTAPDGSLVRPGYDEAGFLDVLAARLPGETEVRHLAGVRRNARGQRESARFGNGVVSRAEYDPLTFRLRARRTERAGSGPVQDLSHVHDPVGNVVRVRDAAQEDRFFANRRVSADAEYRYDSLYRLVEASGREQLAGPVDAADTARTGLPLPGDGGALGRYRERYRYDAAGNLLEVRHRTDSPAVPGWHRSFTHAERSALEPDRTSNRVSGVITGAGPAEGVTYDVHGNMTALPGIPELVWDADDRLAATRRQVGPAAAVETEHHHYDAAGDRVRQVTLDGRGRRRRELIRLGAFEIEREYRGGEVVLERHTLHLADGDDRIALLERRVVGRDPGAARLDRYQHGDHLGSTAVELDGAGAVISYEQYHPYGSTAYQAVRSRTEAPKRHRYCGRARDRCGLSHHGARFYAPWLARWTSCDPIGIGDDANLYRYARSRPTCLVDPSGTQSVGDALDGALELLDSGEALFTQDGQAAQYAVRADIDEFDAVGRPGQTQAQARARALDVDERQFLDTRTNRVTKHVRESSAARPPARPPVSLKNNPAALIDRRFSEVDELRAVFAEAVAKVKDPGSLKPTDLKNRINGHIWDIIKNGDSPAAVATRDALGKLGFQNVPGKGFTAVARKAADTAADAAGATKGLADDAATLVKGAAPEVKAAEQGLATAAKASKLAKVAKVAKVGGFLSLLFIPLQAQAAYSDVTSGDTHRQAKGTLDAVGIVVPVAGFLSLYNEYFVEPAALELHRTAVGAVQEAYGIPLSPSWY